jgi:plastocyanin
MKIFKPGVQGLIGILLTATVGLAAANLGVQYHTSTSKPAAVAVRIDNFSYEPASIMVSPGTTVTWTNADDVPHTVTSRDDPPAFDSGAVDTDESFSFTFTRAGTYAYYCKVHPHMRGVVVVQ